MNRDSAAGRGAALEDLRRRGLADDADPGALQRWLAALGRELDESAEAAASDLLRDLERWDAADDSEQDCAAALAARRLAPELLPRSFSRIPGPGARRRLVVFEHRATGLEMTLLPGGTFTMGTAVGSGETDYRPFDILRYYTLWEHCSLDTEAPPKRVVVAPFLMSIEPVSQAVWDAVGGEDHRLWRDPSLPIEGVGVRAAGDWLRRAGLRLPCEAEWEYACRAGSSALFFWGDELDDGWLWYRANSEFRVRPAELHRSRARWNDFGLVDMSGNVSEWCSDEWFPSHADAPSIAVPRRGSGSELGVQRGGAWTSDAGECRSAARWFGRRRYLTNGAGVRAVASLAGFEPRLERST